jgi:hypothetical protein
MRIRFRIRIRIHNPGHESFLSCYSQSSLPTDSTPLPPLYTETSNLRTSQDYAQKPQNCIVCSWIRLLFCFLLVNIRGCTFIQYRYSIDIVISLKEENLAVSSDACQVCTVHKTITSGSFRSLAFAGYAPFLKEKITEKWMARFL